MFEDDEPSVQRRDVAHDEFPILQNLSGCDSSCVDKEVSGIECSGGTNAGPHDGRQTHCQGDRTNPVIDVTKGRSHCVGRDTQDILDNFLTPPKLGDDLLIGEGGEGRSVTPGVDGDLVLAHILGLKDSWEGNDTRTNHKERGLEGVLVKEVQKVGSVVRRSVVVGKTPCVFCGAIRDVSAANTPTTRPPTTAGVRGSLWVGWAPSDYVNADVWDLYASRLNLGNPLLNLWGISGRNNVKRRVIGGFNV